MSPPNTIGDYKVAIRDRRNIYLGEFSDFDSALSHDDIDANARLIVAAPEMYELLKRLLKYHKARTERTGYGLPREIYDKARRIKDDVD